VVYRRFVVCVSTSSFDFLSLRASFRRQNCDIKDFVRKKKKKKFVGLFPFRPSSPVIRDFETRDIKLVVCLKSVRVEFRFNSALIM
jgi:hypothetical protein